MRNTSALRARGHCLRAVRSIHRTNCCNYRASVRGALLQDTGIPVVRDMPAVGRAPPTPLLRASMFRCSKPITMNELANSLPHAALGVDAVCTVPLWPAGSQCSVLHGEDCLRTQRSTTGTAGPAVLISTPWSYTSRDARGATAHPFPDFSIRWMHQRPDSRVQWHAERVQIHWPRRGRSRFNFLETQSDLAGIDRLAFGYTAQIHSVPALAPYVAEELLPSAMR